MTDTFATSYPVLPLRDIVVFPHMIVPLFVGREKSVRALEEVMADDKQILLSSQIDPSVDDPATDGIYKVGVLANVLQLLKLPDGTVKVLVEGKARVRITDFVEKPEHPPTMPGSDDTSLASMGIYIFNADYLYRLLEEDLSNPASSHDFGKDVIPRVVREGRAIAHPFSMSCVSSTPDAEPYWRDVGTIDAFWEANLDLASVTPELDIYDTNWPIWTSQRQLPPAKFVQDADGKHGLTINTMVSGGCIVSGSHVANSVFFSSVRVHSFCNIDQAIVLPKGLAEREALRQRLPALRLM